MIKRISVLALIAVGLLGGIYTVITVYDNNMTYWRMWETPAVRPHEEPIPDMAEGVVPFDGGEAELRATPAEQLAPPYDKADKEILKAGKKYYNYYCVQCHGKYYDGMATVGQSFSPLPTDLRSPVVQNMPAGYLFRVISYGIPGGRQPALQGTILPEHRWYIISFVQSLGVRQTSQN